MPYNPFTPSFEALPATLPVFPLSGVTLLPFSELQLNIFEPRYLNMVSDALGTGRLIGIVQPKQTAKASNTLYSTGCAGRITIFSETNDGRFLINLTGVCRFDIAEEIATTRGYRRVIVDWQRFEGDLHDDESAIIKTAPLLQSLYNYFEFNNIQVDLDALRKMPGTKLINFLATHLPFEAEEKQVLVESMSLADRSERIITLAKMSIANRNDSTKTRH